MSCEKQLYLYHAAALEQLGLQSTETLKDHRITLARLLKWLERAADQGDVGMTKIADCMFISYRLRESQLGIRSGWPARLYWNWRERVWARRLAQLLRY